MWVIDLRDIVPFISSHDYPYHKTKLSRISCGKDENNREDSHERLSPAQIFRDVKKQSVFHEEIGPPIGPSALPD